LILDLLLFLGDKTETHNFLITTKLLKDPENHRGSLQNQLYKGDLMLGIKEKKMVKRRERVKDKIFKRYIEPKLINFG